MTTEPYRPTRFRVPFCGSLTGEEGDGGIDRALLLAEVEDVTIGLGRVHDAVSCARRLGSDRDALVLVDVEGVQELRVKAGQKHVDDNRDVDLVVRVVGVSLLKVRIRPLLVFDPLLHVLIVEVEFADLVVCAVVGVCNRRE